jgi:hypothetical protein
MNWSSYKPITFNNLTYGQKDVELIKFIDLPAAVAPSRLQLAINTGKVTRTPRALLHRHGWNLVHPDTACADLNSYREYIQRSKAEWSIAKNGYVVGRSGWFSCRSACYMAAGRPVVVQDTGFSKVLPVGNGLLAFSSMEEAVESIHAVNRDYTRHCNAARELAEQYFESGKVLSRLIEAASTAPKE